MRREFIQHRLGILLERLSPPRSIAKNAEAQRHEVQQIAGVISKVIPRDGYEEWWEGFELRLLENHQTRAWPTIREVMLAANMSGKARDEDAVFRAQVNLTIDWLEKTGRAHPVFNNHKMTETLLRGGQLPSLRAARERGFYLSNDDLAKARAEPMTETEWAKHVRVIASLNNCDEIEAEQIARGWLGDENKLMGGK